MPNRNDNDLEADVAVLKDRRTSQDGINKLFFEDIKEIKTDIKTLVIALEKQKSFLGGISFSFSAIGAGLVFACQQAVEYFSGNHHG